MQQDPFALIWDMDGVLVDSASFHFQSWREILKAERGTEITLDEFRLTFGLRNADMLQIVLGSSVSDSAVLHLGNTKEARYRELIGQQGISLLPGVQNWLDYAHAAGWKQAVASSAPRANVEAVVDAVNVRRYFEVLITAEDVSHGKPDPEVFLAAARKMSMSPLRCIVIEDAPAGVQGAQSAGMACIGVLTTHDRLAADFVAASLLDVPYSVVGKLLNR
jgi:beta-phosphoglucomutase